MRQTRPSTRRRGRRVAATAIGLALVVASCSDDDDGSADGSDPTPVAATTAPEPDAPAATDAATPTTPEADAEEAAVTATQPAPTMDPVVGGRLVVAGEAEVGDPWTPAGVHCDSYCNMRIRTFLEPLFVTGDDLQVHPFLAERIEANVDSTVFTIKVREGITFSDGTPLDAAGVIANLDRAAASPLLSGAMKDLAKHPDGTLVVEQLDDHTFTLSTGKDGDPAAPQPWPLFPSLLTGQPGLIASPTWLAAVDGNPDLATQPIGTGPFVVSTFVPGDRMTVRRNPGYWRQDGNGTQLPYLDEIEFRVIVDPQAQAAALDAGDVDLIATADPGVVGTYADSTDPVSLQQRSHGETDYVLFHLTQPQFQDQAVRCALVQAVDRQDLVDVVFGGVGDVASGPFSPDQDGYLDDAGLPVYDPAAASATIAEWEEANGPLAIDYTTTPTGTDQAIADYLQRAWGEVGVDVTSSPVEQSELISAALLGSPELVAARWRNHAGLSVDAQLPWWHGFAADGSGAQVTDGDVALNVGRLNDPVIDDLLDQARSEADPAARQALARRINQRFAEQCWILPLSWTTWGIIMDPAVQNIGRTPLPDGAGTLLDGAGFPGQVWLTSAFVAG